MGRKNTSCFIEETPDYILRDNLSDYDSSSDDFFDEAPEVEQITDTEDDHKTLFSTNVWDMYSDSNYADNILAENKNMAEYLKQQGLSEEEISNKYYALLAGISFQSK